MSEIEQKADELRAYDVLEGGTKPAKNTEPSRKGLGLGTALLMAGAAAIVGAGAGQLNSPNAAYTKQQADVRYVTTDKFEALSALANDLTRKYDSMQSDLGEKVLTLQGRLAAANVSIAANEASIGKYGHDLGRVARNAEQMYGKLAERQTQMGLDPAMAKYIDQRFERNEKMIGSVGNMAKSIGREVNRIHAGLDAYGFKLETNGLNRVEK